ncbi:MAG TPA: hypothetical protein VFS20_14860 [Longimicrobium sp.]|nr:hypothetical protein [Longimicrobium sp.]
MTHSVVPQGPDETARAFLAALDAKAWDAAAAYVLPQLAKRTQAGELSMLLAFVELQASGHPMESGYSIATDGKVDPGLLERFGGVPARGVRGTTTVAELADLTPEAFIARTLENAVAGPTEMPWPPIRYQFVGLVVENDTVAHVLIRELQMDGDGEWRPMMDDRAAVQVLGVRRVDGRWYVVPDWMLLSRGNSAFTAMRVGEDPDPS